VNNEFHSIVDGSPYQLDAADDSDPEVYRSIGQRMTLRRLCEAMITVSSNLATNVLIEKVGVENVQRRVHALKADGMKVLRGVEDGKAFQKGLNNATSARALLILLEALAQNRAGHPRDCDAMLEILKRQKFNDAIPAGLPAGTPVAHKTGEITRINHDAAIVFAPRPFVLVVLARGIEEKKRSAALIAEISRALFEASQQ
jgi:beta-lactamase class A